MSTTVTLQVFSTSSSRFNSEYVVESFSISVISRFLESSINCTSSLSPSIHSTSLLLLVSVDFSLSILSSFKYSLLLGVNTSGSGLTSSNNSSESFCTALISIKSTSSICFTFCKLESSSL